MKYTLQDLADAKGTSEPVREMLYALAKENEALRTQVAELGKDAERYRWLRDTPNDSVGVATGFMCIDAGSSGVIGCYDYTLDGKDLDAAIDAQKGKV